MNRFIDYLHTYFHPHDPCCEELLHYVSLRTGKRGQVYCRADESRPYWCYVLEGMVGAYEMHHKKPYLHWIATKGHYFTGTKHEYSVNGQDLHIQYLRKSTLACLPLSVLLPLQDRYASMHRFVSIIRQRKSDFFNKKSLIMAYDAKDRPVKMKELMPELWQSLNNKLQSEFLHIDLKTIYRNRI